MGDEAKLLGQVFERPGTGEPDGDGEAPGADHWEVISAWTEAGEVRVRLRCGQSGEAVTVSRKHLREPWWRPADTTDPPTLE